MTTTKSEWRFSALDRSERRGGEEQISLCVSSTFINLRDRLSDGLNKPEGSRREPANGSKVSKTEGPLSDRRHPVVAPGERRAAAGSAFWALGDIMNCGVRIIQAGRRRNGKCSSAGLVGSAAARLRNNPTAAGNTGVTHANVHLRPGSSAPLPARKDHVDLKKTNLKTKSNICLCLLEKKDRFSQVGNA